MTLAQWIEQAARILASIEYGDGHDEPFEPFLAQARALYPLVQQAVAAERERCAKVAENWPDRIEGAGIAHAIRQMKDTNDDR